ncbi:MAG: hypothetical protein GQ561_02945, partial [Calditrichae bacterium]|nr:hypothetical protein [Calditrichia bacterium]
CDSSNKVKIKFSNIQSLQNPNNTLSYFVKLEADNQATFIVVYGLDKDCNISTPRINHDAGEQKVLLLGLIADNKYYFQIIAETPTGIKKSEIHSFTTNSLPKKFPKVNVTASDSSKFNNGASFVYLYPYLTAVDMKGNIVWYYDKGKGITLISKVVKLDNGNLMIGAFSFEKKDSRIREINMAGEILKDFEAPGFHHDFFVLPNGHIAYIQETTKDINGKNLVGDGIIELDEAGKVVWSWNAFDHIKTDNYCTSCASRSFYRDKGDDWTHANNVIYDSSDNSYYLSIRHTDSIIKVSRATGKIIWELGGTNDDFNLSANDKFLHQHGPDFQKEGYLLLFDNGNHREPTQYSRVVEYKLDQKKKTASLIWEYKFTGENAFSSSYGDVERLPDGNILIADYYNTLTEITPAGEIVWQVEMFQPRSKLHQVLRVPNLYSVNFN